MIWPTDSYHVQPRGDRMPEGGTARGDECVVCGRRFTIRYYVRRGGPFCGDHIPTTDT